MPQKLIRSNYFSISISPFTNSKRYAFRTEHRPVYISSSFILGPYVSSADNKNRRKFGMVEASTVGRTSLTIDRQWCLIPKNDEEAVHNKTILVADKSPLYLIFLPKYEYGDASEHSYKFYHRVEVQNTYPTFFTDSKYNCIALCGYK